MVKFGNRRVGDGAPVFVTFEAGPTHDGLETAKQLVTIAAEAGADAVKFQIIDPDRLVADRTVPISFEILVDRETGRTETVTAPVYDLLCDRAMSNDDWRELKRHADTLGLAFFATIGFEDEVDFMEDLGCHSIKIASADVDHLPLIRRVARTGMCVQLDTGRSTLGEIERAVDVVRHEGNEDIIIHQCPSGYPARLPSINLNIIKTLKQMFPYPVAFSDHTPGWEMDVAAVAMGANLVEKTISLDRMTPSIEHIFSLEPGETKKFIQVIRDLETAMGTPRRIMHDEELEHRKSVRRSLHLEAPVKAGQRLDEARVIFRRPGFGIPPDVYETMVDREFAKDLPAGHILEFADLR